jgi:NADPH-dependent curcumin reductase
VLREDAPLRHLHITPYGRYFVADIATALSHTDPMTQPQRIVLARHITGAPSPDDFTLESFELPPLREGQFLVRNHYVSADPGTRSRLSGTDSYAGALPIGAPIDGFAVGEVIESLNEHFPIGQLVTLGAGWSTHTVSGGRGYCAKLPDLGVPLSAWIGVLGVPGMTAYFGLKRVAGLKEGERMLVTSAAGPVGATAGQLARAWGASQVWGVASAGPKAEWLTSEAGFDGVVDYRAQDFDAQIAAAMPEGIDVLFDNVGNAMIDRLLPFMRSGGRIVVSGQVADYNVAPADRVGIRNTDRFITHRLRMEGLVVFDDLRAFPAAQAQCAAMITSGQLKLKEVVSDGIESLPEAFCALFQQGSAFGRRIAKLV